MSDLFKLGIKGYDRQEVDKFIGQMVENYEMELGHLNVELSKMKQENNHLLQRYELTETKTTENEEALGDKNLKMQAIVLEQKLKDKLSLVEAEMNERKELEETAKAFVKKQMQEVEQALCGLDSQQEVMDERLRALQMTLDSEEKKSHLQSQLQMLNQRIASTSKCCSDETLVQLESQIKNNNEILDGLEMRKKKEQTSIVDRLAIEKAKVGDVLIDAHTEAQEMVHEAKERMQEVINVQMALYAKEEGQLDEIEMQLKQLKQAVKFNLSKQNIDTCDIELVSIERSTANG